MFPVQVAAYSPGKHDRGVSPLDQRCKCADGADGGINPGIGPRIFPQLQGLYRSSLRPRPCVDAGGQSDQALWSRSAPCMHIRGTRRASGKVQERKEGKAKGRLLFDSTFSTFYSIFLQGSPLSFLARPERCASLWQNKERIHV